MPQTIFCPGCGEGLPADSAVCPACSTRLPQSATEWLPDEGVAGSTPGNQSPHGWMDSPEPPRPVTPLPTTPPYQPPAAQPYSFSCPGCGRVIPGNVSFCPQCGRNLQASQSYQPHQSVPPQFAAPPAAQKRSANDQLLVIILAVIAACVILGLFC